jgi:hypothetical protein
MKKPLLTHIALLAVCIALLTLARNLADYTDTALGWAVAIIAAIGIVVFIVMVVRDVGKKPEDVPAPPPIQPIGSGIGALMLPVPTFQLTFDYVPKSPLTEGWKKGYGKEEPTFSKWWSSPRGMTMTQTQCYAMDYHLPQFAKLCNHVEFTAQFVSDVIIYFDVEIIKKDKSEYTSYWFAQVIGVQAPLYLEQYKEWKFHVAPDHTGKFVIDLRDEVQQALGREGFMFAGVKTIRLRGTLSISPILFRQLG